VQRRVRHRGGQHKDIGVYDRITWNFVRYILGYRRQMAPRVRDLIADHAGNAQVVVLRSRHATRGYLATVSGKAARSAGAMTGGGPDARPGDETAAPAAVPGVRAGRCRPARTS
jgi:hypothetical protein